LETKKEEKNIATTFNNSLPVMKIDKKKKDK
jgi:hypothetical protein